MPNENITVEAVRQRYAAAQAAIAAVITDKGGTVNSGDGFEEFADDIGTIPQGGGGGQVIEKDINFYDYDATLLHSYTFSEVLALTELPQMPTHEGLTAVGWNYTLAELQQEANNKNWVNVGCYFNTSDGKTHIHINMEKAGGFQFYLIQGAANSAVIDWGDGSPTEMLSVSSGTANNRTRYLASHTYSAAGKYDISISAVTGKWYGFGSTNYTSYGIAGDNLAYGLCIEKIHISSDAKLNGTAFCEVGGAKIITMTGNSQANNSNSKYTYYGCKSLLFALAADGIASDAFSICRSLRVISAHNCNSIEQLAQCYMLESIAPLNVRTIPSNTFYSCPLLRRIKIPSSCTSIQNNSFNRDNQQSCLEELDLTAFTSAESIPTLGSSLTNILTSDLKNKYGKKIKLSVSSEAMKTAFSNATNWSAGADNYVVKE